MVEEKGKEQKESQEAVQKLYAFVLEQMKAGADKAAISQKLVEKGVDENDATVLVDKMHSQILEAAQREQLTSSSIVLGLVGGLLAAIVGGVVWGLIVIVTGHEIGYVAWAVGLAAGYSVVFFTKGKRGVPLQVIAVVSSLVGIVIGKYLTFFHALKTMLAEEHGEEAASNISVFSGAVIQFFFDNIISMSHLLDLLWIFLAVVTAWKIPRGSGLKLGNPASTLNVG